MYTTNSPALATIDPSSAVLPVLAHENHVLDISSQDKYKPHTVCPKFIEESSTGYQVRSSYAECKSLSDESFQNRAPVSLQKRNDSGSDDDDDDKDKEDAVYSNQHPNEWMSEINQPADTSAAEVNTYAGMGIEEENFNTMSKGDEYGSTRSLDAVSNARSRAPSFQVSQNNLPKLQLNDQTLSNYESEPRSSRSQSVSEGKSNSPSLESTVYDTGSSYGDSDEFDFVPFDTSSIQNSRSTPNLNAYQSETKAINPFETTQSIHNINHISTMDQPTTVQEARSELTVPNVKPILPSSQSHPELAATPPSSPPPISTPDLTKSSESSIPPASKFPALSSDYVMVTEPSANQQPSAELEQMLGDTFDDEDE